MSRRHREWLQRLALALGSLLVVAIVAEGVLRIAWSGYYPKFDPEHPLGEFEFHPERGLTPAPGREKFDWTREYGIWQRHNSLGFRGPEFAVEKPAGKLRLMVIGDSQTYGTGVENDETFSAVLGELEPGLQVINAGVGGYGTDRELLMMREWVPVLEPDLVLVAYFWNDFVEIQKRLYTHAELVDGEVRFVPPEPATLEHPYFAGDLEKHAKLKERYGWIRRESRLYRFLSDRFKVLDYATREWRYGKGEQTTTLPLDVAPEGQEDALALTLGLFREMKRLADAHDARIALLLIPDQVEVEPGVVVYGVPDFLPEIQDLVGPLGRQAGLPVIDLERGLRTAREEVGEPLYFQIDRHLNPLGHRQVAKLLRAELRSLGWLDSVEADGNP